MGTKLSVEQVINKISHLTHISLDASTYIGTGYRARFVDSEYGEFWVKVSHVISGRCGHPARKLLKKRATCLERYGEEEPMRSAIIKDIQRKAVIEKYGVENVSQNKEVFNKIRRTTLERYGEEYAIKTDNVKQKQKETNVCRYGVENVSQNKQIRSKAKQTTLSRYGHEYYSKTDEYRNNHGLNICKYSIDGKTISQICRESGVPYSWVGKICRSSGEASALGYISTYKANKTSIEAIFEQYIGFNKFDKKALIDMPYRPDFKISESSYVDVDGLYWHSSGGPYPLDKLYHFNKRKQYESNSIRLFQFREDEISNKISIVKSIVDNHLGRSSRIYARKTKVRKVSQQAANEFLTSCHLMGTTKANHLGLYLDNQLVCIMSYTVTGNTMKIQRFCSTLGYTVVGGFSKLLSTILVSNKSIKEVHNWVDLRYGTGKHLESKGFELTRETLGWRWTDHVDTYNRRRCRANMDDRKLSEAEHAAELGLYKIYDAGQRLYVLKIKQQ